MARHSDADMLRWTFVRTAARVTALNCHGWEQNLRLVPTPCHQPEYKYLWEVHDEGSSAWPRAGPLPYRLRPDAGHFLGRLPGRAGCGTGRFDPGSQRAH